MLTYIVFGERTSMRAMGCCGMIIAGFLLGIDQEKGLGSLSFTGVLYGLLASLFVALNAIYTKKSLNAVDNNIWKLTIYNNFNACIIFLPLILIFNEQKEILYFPKIFDGYFWFAMTVSGVLGFSMGYVTSLQIQVTSALTHNVSGTAKAYVQTLLGVMYYHEVKTYLWWFSNVLVLVGAALYSQVRGKEMKSKHQQQSMQLPTLNNQDVGGINSGTGSVKNADADLNVGDSESKEKLINYNILDVINEQIKKESK